MGTVVLAVALFGSHRVEAVALVYFEEDGGGSNPRGLYNYDTATGVSTLRATVSGSERFFGMDVRLSDRTVFAADLGGGLWTMDINTGTHTLIGATGLGAAGSELVGLAFHPMTDDLFGLRNNGGLYSINPLSGISTFLGDTSPADRGLSFSPSGQLFAFTDAGDLYLVDPTDGNVAPVGGTGNPITGISEDSAFAASGELFATDFFGTIFQTDPVTGNGFVIGTTGMGNGLLGLIAVPEPSTGLLLLMGLATLLVCQRRLHTV